MDLSYTKSKVNNFASFELKDAHFKNSALDALFTVKEMSTGEYFVKPTKRAEERELDADLDTYIDFEDSEISC
jgi:hypothetical protein